jgi:hypothetical protein
MGADLEMKMRSYTLIGLLALCLPLLAACGNGGDAKDALSSLKAGKGLLTMTVPGQHKGTANLASLDPATAATLRSALEKGGQPALAVGIPTLGYVNIMGVYGQNGPVQTWASQTYETVSLNNGILVATRGFGPDLMTAVAPDLTQVSRASGSFHRIYYYLDGADQTVSTNYDCDFAPAGKETITVLGKAYATRKVTESCLGPQTPFENTYWFDASGRLRQSAQRMTPGLAPVMLQRVID